MILADLILPEEFLYPKFQPSQHCRMIPYPPRTKRYPEAGSKHVYQAILQAIIHYKCKHPVQMSIQI